jgi:predicted SAM-dependent methyltransferase
MWLAVGGRCEHKGAVLLDIRAGIGDVCGDIRDLHIFDTDQFEGIELHHVLEHLLPNEDLPTLIELKRVICPGGKLCISVPDIERCAQTILSGNLEILMNIYSPHEDEAMRHKWGYTEKSLLDILHRAGFNKVQIVLPTEPHEIRMEAYK